MSLDPGMTARVESVARSLSERLGAAVQIQHAAGRRWEYVAGQTRSAPVVPGQYRTRGAWRIVVLSDEPIPDAQLNDVVLQDAWDVLESPA